MEWGPILVGGVLAVVSPFVVKYTARSVSRQVVADLTEAMRPKWKDDVEEIVQSRLDNGSELRRTLDAFRAEFDLRMSNVERQLENVITEEIPQITALAAKALELDDPHGTPQGF